MRAIKPKANVHQLQEPEQAENNKLGTKSMYITTTATLVTFIHRNLNMRPGAELQRLRC